METISKASRTDGDDVRMGWRGGVALAIVAAAAVLVLGACQAPLEQKRGGLSEFCNGSDEQCRQGLVCQDGVCTSLNDAPEVCETVCNRFDECAAGIDKCNGSCLNTLKYWGKRQTKTYETCYEDTSCAAIESHQKPWNICYQQLELKDSRKKRCQALKEASQTCLDDIGGGYDEELRNFGGACKEKARTVSPRRWSKTEKCVEFANQAQIQCGNMFRCINEKFPVGSKKFPTTRPE